MKFVVATESSTLMRWCRASLLASPTVLPASMVPWRWIVPVRARIASSSVVLPLWNGPTSAMHRGPVARVPFCAIFRLPCRARCGLLRDRFNHRFRPEGDWQEASESHQPRREPERTRARSTTKTAAPRGGRSSFASSLRRSRSGAQMQFRYAEREIEPDRRRHRDWLQRHRVIRTAEEDVGAEPGGDRHLPARAEIVAGEKAGARRREAVGEHR